MSNIFNVNVEKSTFRVCTESEREAFSDAYRLYEQYANIDGIEGKQAEDDFWMKVDKDATILAGKSALHCELIKAVMEYLDKRMTGKETDNGENK